MSGIPQDCEDETLNRTVQMIATHIAELLDRIRAGVIEASDTIWLEQAPADKVVDELRSTQYRLIFQERQVGNKTEVSLARSAELAFQRTREPASVTTVYLDCVVLSIADNQVTGLSRFTRLTVWAVTRPEPVLALRSGRGFKLDHTPDGWQMKPMRKRVVRLSVEFLRKRGWCFDHLQQFIPTASQQ